MLDILIVCWTESVIIGVLNVLRMSRTESGNILAGIRLPAKARAIPEIDHAAIFSKVFPAIKLFTVVFFIFNYGMFCLGHLVGVLALFVDQGDSGGFAQSLQTFWEPEYWIAAIAIGFSHTYSYYANYLGKSEYENIGLFALMQRPYGRIFAMHIAIIAGGFFVELLGSPQFSVFVLVFAKTAMDLSPHNKEHSKLSIPAASEAAAA